MTEPKGIGSRARWIAGGAIAVFAIALVFVLMSAFGTPDDAVTRPDVRPTITQDAVTEAKELLRSGETTAALAVLEKHLSTNPTDTEARKLVVEARKSSNSSAGSSSSGGTAAGSGTGGSGSGSGTGGSTPPPGDDDPLAQPVNDIGALLPVSVSGFTLDEPVIVPNDASISGAGATQALRAAGASAIFSVHDRGSVQTAGEYLANVSKPVFPKEGSTVTIDGHAGYYGTDGTGKLTVAYVRGRYVFEVLVTVKDGQPAALREQAIAAAAAFRD